MRAWKIRWIKKDYPEYSLICSSLKRVEEFAESLRRDKSVKDISWSSIEIHFTEDPFQHNRDIEKRIKDSALIKKLKEEEMERRLQCLNRLPDFDSIFES